MAEALKAGEGVEKDTSVRLENRELRSGGSVEREGKSNSCFYLTYSN